MKITIIKTLATALVLSASMIFAGTPKQDCLKQVNDSYGKSRAACNKMKGGAKSGKQDCYRTASLQKTAAAKNCK
ncbi:MAG: hypothetical protein U1F27_10460 [Turneriella sp.]